MALLGTTVLDRNCWNALPCLAEEKEGLSEYQKSLAPAESGSDEGTGGIVGGGSTLAFCRMARGAKRCWKILSRCAWSVAFWACAAYAASVADDHPP